MFTKTVCILLLVLSCNFSLAQDRPNILFIAVDDLRNELGVLQGSQAITPPNLDALANSGSLFTHHFVQVPTCGASRHALLTGRRPYLPVHLSNNALVKQLSTKPETDQPETFIHQLKRSGYYTVGIGKIPIPPMVTFMAMRRKFQSNANCPIAGTNFFSMRENGKLAGIPFSPTRTEKIVKV